MKFTGERFIPAESDIDLALEHLQRYYSIVDLVKDKIVLDVACGEGYGSAILSGNAKFVYGIDISEEAITHAQLNYVRDNLKFEVGTVDSLPFPDQSVDIVVSFETIEHVDEIQQNLFMKEVKRVLKNGGMLIISTPNKLEYSDKPGYKNPFHVKEFYLEEFYRFLQAYFNHVRLYYQKFEVASLITDYKNDKYCYTNFDSDYLKKNGKYLIAACSDSDINININSIRIVDQDRLNWLISRILTLQDEVEERNNHIKKLDETISQMRNELLIYNERIKNFELIQDSLNKENDNKNSLLSSQSEDLKTTLNMLQNALEEVNNEKNINLENTIKIKENETKIKMLEQELKYKQEALTDLNNRLRSEMEVLNSTEAELKAANHQIFENELKIQVLEQELKYKKEALADLNNRLQVEMEVLQSTEAELKAANQQILDLTIKLKSIESDLLRRDLDLKHKDEQIANKEEQIAYFLSYHDELTSSIENYTKNSEVQLNDKITILQEQEETIRNLKGHIEQLLEQERLLNNILHSGGWKALSFYYKFRDSLFPNGTKRRLFAKLAMKALTNPNKMLRNINKKNLKKLSYYLKVENPERVESRIENYLERHTEQEKTEYQLIDNSDFYEKLVFPKTTEPIVSIVIPVFNQWHYTYSCLCSILKNTTGVDYEVIIADDVSTDETANISNYVENINVIRDDVNRGFLLNCNNAAKFAKGKYIYFLNNDTNVQPGWLSSLVELMEKDNSIGMSGSKLVYPDGRLQEAGGIIWKDASGWNYGRLDDPEKPEYNYVKEVDYISGAAIMIRRDLWEQIGGFDERYVPAYNEDSDLAFEVRKLGWKVVYQPKSVIVHYEGISHGTDTGSGIKRHQIENCQKFFKKWEMTLEKEHFHNAEHVYWARDRSRTKKTILIIDHYVPHFDKDAGSRTVFQYVKLFVEMGFNVKFIGDNFFRHEPYTSVLQQMGVEVLYGKWFADHINDWLETNGEYINFTLLNRPHISIKYIDAIKKYTKSKIIYYGHDLHYLREQREFELTNNQALLDSSRSWRKMEFGLFEKSDLIYYPSQVEVEEIKKQFPDYNVKAIPAYIFDEPLEKAVHDFSNRKNLLFVGGFGHRPNVDAVLWFVNEIFPIILKDLPDIRFYVVGSNPPDEIKNLHSENVIVTGFVSDQELSKYYHQCKIAVVPLRYGAGVKGKVVEALYHQIPIVTTSIGSEGLEGIGDYLIEVDDARQFAQKVISLYNDISKLNDYSKKSIDYIMKYFSRSSALEILNNDFQ
jgi:GT2 family glycosyltransferase/2-polyprenyl-3-methyl-5-hydroxy-6-metoxy-1,4-benzoquinol methylase